jgi:hypothetical protein
MNKDEALRLALEALEKLFGIPDKWTGEGEGDVAVWRLGGSYRAQQAITAIKAALEAKDEPVAGQPLPCPFCGHVGLNFADGETYRWGVASCGGCGASCGDIRREYPDLGEWHTEAIAEWNRRSPAPQRTWVGLTDDDKVLIKHDANYNQFMTAGEYADRVQQLTEARLKDKNT